MFPQPAYNSFSWPMNHHMGVVTSRTLFAFAWAAATFRDADDPVARVNEYIIHNNIVPPNIRNGQPDVWRDYQQILPELGLIVSTRLQRRITPTPLGLAYLDKSIGFPELMALQAFRYQYPNGQKESFAPTQVANRVLIRPAVLIWQVLRGLEQAGHEAALSIDDIQCYLSRCSTHQDTQSCIAALALKRNGGNSLSRVGNRRHFQEWIRFLLKTPLFIGNTETATDLQISRYAHQYSAQIDLLCEELEQPQSFWIPKGRGELSRQDRFDWFAFYGSFDLGLSSLPVPEAVPADEDNSDAEITAGLDSDEEDGNQRATTKQINLRTFDKNHLRSGEGRPSMGGSSILSSYDAGLSDNMHRLHDLMVIYIAELCRRRGGRVYDDPATVDLLVEYKNTEFIIEVKSVTSRNFVKKLRYAVGQVYHYDYLRAQASNAPRRRVVAVAGRVPRDSWAIPFVNNFVNSDMLSLHEQTIQVDTSFPLSAELFAPQG